MMVVPPLQTSMPRAGHQMMKNKKANIICSPYGWVSCLHRAATTDLPLLRSGPGGFIRSWPYRTYPYFCIIYNQITAHRPYWRSPFRFTLQRYSFFLILQAFTHFLLQCVYIRGKKTLLLQKITEKQ